jgi:hypothetical protein
MKDYVKSVAGGVKDYVGSKARNLLVGGAVLGSTLFGGLEDAVQTGHNYVSGNRGNYSTSVGNKAYAGGIFEVRNVAEDGSGIGGYESTLDMSDDSPSATKEYDVGLDHELDTTIVPGPNAQFFVIYQYLQEEGGSTMYDVEKNFTQYAQVGDEFTWRLSAENRLSETFVVDNSLYFPINSMSDVLNGNTNGVDDFDISFKADADNNGSYDDPWDYSINDNLSNVLQTPGKSIGGGAQLIPFWFDVRDGDYYGTFTITATGPGILFDSADFDEDYDVDNADLASWTAGYGIGSGAVKSDGDSDMDGDVDGADFLNWQQQYGNTTGAVSSIYSTGVPEPNTLAITLIAFFYACGIRRLR